MLTHFTTVRSERDTSQLPCPAMPNGVSASSTSLTPTATNAVSLGLSSRFPSNSSLPFQEAQGKHMVLRLSAEPGTQSCSSGQPGYCCSARSHFPRQEPRKPPPPHRQLHELWLPRPNCRPSPTCRSISKL